MVLALRLESVGELDLGGAQFGGEARLLADPMPTSALLGSSEPAATMPRRAGGDI